MVTIMTSNMPTVKNDTPLYMLKHDGNADGLRVSNRSITLGNTIFVGLGMTAVLNYFVGAKSKTDLSFSLSVKFLNNRMS